MRLLSIYPRAWRTRYGAELATLIEELDSEARLTWRDRVDIVSSGVRERVHAFRASSLPPHERAREGFLLVLYAWMLFVIGGFGVQKASEHWRAVTPATKQSLPAAGFDILVITAGLSSAFILIGAIALLPRFAALIRRGDIVTIRRPVLRAMLLSMLAVGATAALAAWAHSLSPAQRNGRDALYGTAFLAWVALFTACLFAWAAAAAATARQLTLPAQTIRFEVWIGAGVSTAMVIMTVATAVWWGSLASAAPWFFEGRAAGASGSALQLNIILPVVVMLCATALGLIGTTRAINALAKLSNRGATP